MGLLPPQGALLPVIPLDHAEGLEIAALHPVPLGRGADEAPLTGHLGGQGGQTTGHMLRRQQQFLEQDALLVQVFGGGTALELSHGDAVQTAAGDLAHSLLIADQLLAVGDKGQACQRRLPDGVVLRRADGFHLVLREGGRGHAPQQLYLAGEKAGQIAHHAEKFKEPSLGGHHSHAVSPPGLQKLVHIEQKLPAIALAAHIGVGSQGVDIPGGGGAAAWQVDGLRQQGQHGGQLPVLQQQEGVLRPPAAFIEPVNIAGVLPKGGPPQVLLGLGLAGPGGTDLYHRNTPLCFRQETEHGICAANHSAPVCRHDIMASGNWQGKSGEPARKQENGRPKAAHSTIYCCSTSMRQPS